MILGLPNVVGHVPTDDQVGGACQDDDDAFPVDAEFAVGRVIGRLV